MAPAGSDPSGAQPRTVLGQDQVMGSRGHEFMVGPILPCAAQLPTWHREPASLRGQHHESLGLVNRIFPEGHVIRHGEKGAQRGQDPNGIGLKGRGASPKKSSAATIVTGTPPRRLLRFK